ncbi:MAG: glycosyltransferase [Betaproteobacteria bacterium]
MNRVLMVAFHFPPLAGSSGIQRTLRFASHLPECGWEPLVLTADPRAYERTSDDQLAEIPRGCVVERAFAFDSARHFALAGRYPGFLARPDRWVSWWFGAVARGMSMIRRFKPSALWSTYPIATAHKVGLTLHRLSRLPLVADFRDPMAQDGYPADPLVWRSYQRIEEAAVTAAAASVFVTPGAMRRYAERYPHATARLRLIENGYDEQSFTGAADGQQPGGAEPLVAGAFTLLHSGIVYPKERDPACLFAALRRMRQAGVLRAGELRVRLRAAGHEALLSSMIQKEDIGDVVELCPPIPYRQALNEMQRADGLLVLQAADCNDQIPAKVYEYLRCGRPILGLTDAAGDTADLLRRVGVAHIAPLDSPDDIARVTRSFIADVRGGRAAGPAQQTVRAFSREQRTAELARLLDSVAGSA